MKSIAPKINLIITLITIIIKGKIKYTHYPRKSAIIPPIPASDDELLLSQNDCNPQRIGAKQIRLII